jgi:hypothetical protein
MIAQGTRHFVKGADTRIAAFRKGTVKAGTVNSGIAGNSQHTPRLRRISLFIIFYLLFII